MSKKAFTMASNRYCGDCGSFDLMIIEPSRIQRALGRRHSVNYCFGCGCHCEEKDFLGNSLRTLPLTVDDFFFQTNLKIESLEKRQIQPMIRFLSIGLIIGVIGGLFLYKSPSELEGMDSPMLEWVNAQAEVLEAHETVVVKALQRELDQLVNTR